MFQFKDAFVLLILLNNVKDETIKYNPAEHQAQQLQNYADSRNKPEMKTG